MAEGNKPVRWSKAVVTNTGTKLLNEYAAGRILNITNAYGSVSAPGSNLMEQEELPNGRTHPLTIESVTKTDSSVTVCIQVTSIGNTAPYKLDQVGVYAITRDPGEMKDSNGVDQDDRLLMIIEDVEDENGSKGITIPAESDQLYTFKLYAVLTITNKDRLEISVSSAGIATLGAINDALKKHDQDSQAHPEIQMQLSELEKAGGGAITGESDPTLQTKARVGQRYLNTKTGKEFVCIGVEIDPEQHTEVYIWEPEETRIIRVVNEALSKLSIGPTIVEASIIGGGQAWVESDAPTGYYYQDVPVEGCREWHRARVIIQNILDMPYVRAMEILPTVETRDSCIRVWGRKQIGAKSIAISVELYSEGAGSGTGTGYTLPVASADRLGGVKVGSGVDVEEDGTISVDAAGALGAAIATPDEVNAALDQAFEEKGGGEDGRQL